MKDNNNQNADSTAWTGF